MDFELASTRGDRERKINGNLRISSVGSATHEGEKCRWLEYQMTMIDGGQERVIVAKILVPEKHLKAGEDALTKRVRGWIRMHKDADVDELIDRRMGPLRSFLAGPLKDKKEQDAVEIDNSKLGKLSCPGVTGTFEYAERNGLTTVNYEIRRNEKAPFGVVTCKMTIENRRNGEVREAIKGTFTLSDHGKGAKSALDKKLRLPRVFRQQ